MAQPWQTFSLLFLEQEWLSETCTQNPSLYLRYVDDIFAIFRQGIDINAFLTKINKAYPSIKFTVEEATETLPFLDVEIKLKEDSYDSWVWRKKTHTGVMLNYNAIAPTKWKFGLIICLLNRIWDICSSRMHFNKEVEILKNIFISNGCLGQFYDSPFLGFGTQISWRERQMLPWKRITYQ